MNSSNPSYYAAFPFFYAVPLHNENDIVQGFYTPYFYLHGEAERINGYDICKGDSHALSHCLMQSAFLCSLQFTDHSVENAICFSKWNGRNRMEGLVCLLSDEEGIQDAVSYLGFTHIPDMYSNEQEYLKKINKLSLLVPSIQ